MKKMFVKFINGINGDRVEIKIKDSNELLFVKEYVFGYNASYNRFFERNAKIDNENAIKYNWKGFFPLKPYIGDIFKDLIKIYSIENENIECSGIYIMNKEKMNKEQAYNLFKKYIEK